MGMVSLIRCDDYALAAEKLQCVLAPLGGMEAFVKPGERVLVKPNAVMGKPPESAVCTHPAVVAAVCREIKRIGATAIIAESPGGPFNPVWVRRTLDACGIWPACEKEGAILNDDFTSRDVAYPQGVAIQSVKLISAALDCDKIINVCKLKTHGMMLYTGAVKNLFGLVPGTMKPKAHALFPNEASFGAQLNDICLTVGACLHIIDGIVGMEGDGPTSGSPRKLGALIASANPWEADHVASGMIGLRLPDVKQNTDAIVRGLYDPDTMRVTGDHPADFTCSFRLPSTFHESGGNIIHVPKKYQKFFQARPFVTKKCIGCGICSRNCPMHVIEMKNRKAVIHLKRCIRCYCCQELCPERAVEAVKPLLAKLFMRSR